MFIDADTYQSLRYKIPLLFFILKKFFMLAPSFS
jgi:hypothetical protein